MFLHFLLSSVIGFREDLLQLKHMEEVMRGLMQYNAPFLENKDNPTVQVVNRGELKTPTLQCELLVHHLIASRFDVLY